MVRGDPDVAGRNRAREAPGGSASRRAAGLRLRQAARGGPVGGPPRSEADALAAAAGALHLRIDELEAAAHQRGRVFQRRAVEVHVALRVDEDPHGPVLEGQHLVLGTRLAVGPLEQVREARAATAADTDAQPLRPAGAGARGLLDLVDGALCDFDGHLNPPWPSFRAWSCSRRWRA